MRVVSGNIGPLCSSSYPAQHDIRLAEDVERVSQKFRAVKSWQRLLVPNLHTREHLGKQF